MMEHNGPKFRRTCEEEEDKLKYSPAASPSPSYYSAASPSLSYYSAFSPSPSRYSAAPPSLNDLLPTRWLDSSSFDPHKEASTKAYTDSPSTYRTKASNSPSHYSAAPAPSNEGLLSCWLNSLSLDPHKEASTNAYTDSPSTSRSKAYTDSPSTFTFPSAGDRSLFAQVALDYYNMKNASNYQLVDALLSNIMVVWDGTWFHSNFMAKGGDSFPKLFFAEINADTMTVTACLILDGCETAVGCAVCINVIHPIHGFFRGNRNPKLITTDSSPIVKSKRYPDSPFNTSTSTLPVNPKAYDEIMSEKQLRCAKAALEYYNKENDADYEIAGSFDSRAFIRGAYWLHCNFTAKPRNGDIFPKLFFAEMRCPRQKHSGEGGPWTVTACLVLEGKTTDGCNLCHKLIHPIHGFSQGNHKSQRKGLPPIINRRIPETEKRSRRAEIALEDYNKENGTDYELSHTMGSNGFTLDGDCNWYHLDFKAWQNVDGKYTRRSFFAEMFEDLLPEMEYLTVTACVKLDRISGITGGCAVCCPTIVHPTHGFLKGVPKPVLYKSPLMPSIFEPNPFETNPSRYCRTYPDPMEVPHPGRTRVKMALEYYNQKNGTDYKLVDALASNGLFNDGAWLHYNFTATAPNVESPEHFFAEMVGVPKYSPIEFTWTVTACLILKEGKTTRGCNFCPDREVIHPNHGFVIGLHKN